MSPRAFLLGLILWAGALPPGEAWARGRSFRFEDVSVHRLPSGPGLPGTASVDIDAVDVDGDGDLDLFIAEGAASLAGRPDRLLINDGSGTFFDESVARLPAAVTNSSKSDWGDVDGDGDLDGVIGTVGPERLLLNDGHGFFVDASLARLPPPPGLLEDISAEARFADVDGDGDLDILIANENPFVPSPLAGGQNRLYVNLGGGFFTDETAARLPLRADQTGGFVTGDIEGDGDLLDPSLDVELADLDGDGDLDVAVANSDPDGEERLYLQRARGGRAVSLPLKPLRSGSRILPKS